MPEDPLQKDRSDFSLDELLPPDLRTCDGWSHVFEIFFPSQALARTISRTAEFFRPLLHAPERPKGWRSKRPYVPNAEGTAALAKYTLMPLLQQIDDE